MVFHGVLAVAPLKRRRQGLGLLLAHVFHGVLAVAPLKPLRVVLILGFPRRLPRRPRRGPIEATRARRRAYPASAVFHGVLAVAPLKRQVGVAVHRLRPVFHGVLAVAPLKPRTALE